MTVKLYASSPDTSTEVACNQHVSQNLDITQKPSGDRAQKAWLYGAGDAGTLLNCCMTPYAVFSFLLVSPSNPNNASFR